MHELMALPLSTSGTIWRVFVGFALYIHEDACEYTVDYIEVSCHLCSIADVPCWRFLFMVHSACSSYWLAEK